MSNLLSYLDENAAFQNFLQGKAEMAQQITAEKQQQVEGGLESLTLAGGPLLEKIGSGVKKTMELYSKGSEAVSKFKAAGIKIDEALNKTEAESGDIIKSLSDNIGSKLSNIVQSKVSGAVNDLRGVIKAPTSSLDELSSRASSSISKVGTNMSKRLQMNEFDRDPESDLSSLEENRSLINNIRSVFRGTGEKISTSAEESMTSARGLAQEGMESLSKVGQEAATEVASKASSTASEIGSKIAASTAETVAETIGEGAATAISEAIPVVGELAMVGTGIYDLIHSIHEKPQVVTMMARPVYNAGL